MRLVQSLHRAYPGLTYDVTIKVEHLLKHAGLLPVLRDTGCVLVTSAVESVDDKVLEILDKGHTREDVVRVVRFCREAGLNLAPTFVTFTPWLSLEGYAGLLSFIEDLNLVESVAPVQLAIRLLITAGSRLLERAEVQSVIGRFDEASLSYQWAHPDPRVDELQRRVEALVAQMQKQHASRTGIFREVRRLTDSSAGSLWHQPPLPAQCTVPYLTEPWFC